MSKNPARDALIASLRFSWSPEHAEREADRLLALMRENIRPCPGCGIYLPNARHADYCPYGPAPAPGAGEQEEGT